MKCIMRYTYIHNIYIKIKIKTNVFKKTIFIY